MVAGGAIRRRAGTDMRDRIELRPSRTPNPRREGRDLCVILLGWAAIAGMGAPLALGYLSVLAPGAFSALMRAMPAAPASAGRLPAECRASPCRLR